MTAGIGPPAARHDLLARGTRLLLTTGRQHSRVISPLVARRRHRLAVS
jgi:hypothetical protein